MLVTGVLSPAAWSRRLYIELGMSDSFLTGYCSLFHVVRMWSKVSSMYQRIYDSDR
jgi:hypothetical protein